MKAGPVQSQVYLLVLLERQLRLAALGPRAGPALTFDGERFGASNDTSLPFLWDWLRASDHGIVGLQGTMMDELTPAIRARLSVFDYVEFQPGQLRVWFSETRRADRDCSQMLADPPYVTPSGRLAVVIGLLDFEPFLRQRASARSTWTA